MAMLCGLIRRERIHLAGTWTFITAACFLAWTAVIFLALPRWWLKEQKRRPWHRVNSEFVK
jgi:hypothetical protein